MLKLPLLLDDIEKTMNLLIETVENSFVTISYEVGGWHHYLNTNKVSNLGSALGLTFINYKIKKIDRRGLLVLNLLENDINKDNGFGIKIVDGGKISLTESTSYICISLIGYINKLEAHENGKKAVDLIIKLIKWLVKNKNPAEGWGPIKGTESRVFSTSISLFALQCAFKNDNLDIKSNTQLRNEIVQAIGEAVNWLIDSKNNDGGWGEIPKNQTSTAFHTSIAIASIKYSNVVQDDKIFIGTKKWLLDQWDKKQMLENSGDSTNLTEMYHISLGNDKWSRATWNHFPTPWAIIALNAMGEDFTSYEILESLKWLLIQSKNGYIIRTTDSSPPIWAIWDTLLVFDKFIKNYQRKYISFSKPKRLLLRGISSIFYALSNIYGYLLLMLYLLIGCFFVYQSIITVENYIYGLFIPISIIILDKIIK